MDKAVQYSVRSPAWIARCSIKEVKYMRAAHRVFYKDNIKAHFEFCDLPDCSCLSMRGVCSKLNVPKCLGEKSPLSRSPATAHRQMNGGAAALEAWTKPNRPR